MVDVGIGYMCNREDANGTHCTDPVAIGRLGEPIAGERSGNFAGLSVGREGKVTVEPSR